MKSKKILDIEEALGIIWTRRERNEKNRARIKEVLDQGVGEGVFEELLRETLIRAEGENIEFLPAGETIGRDVTRRHRLAERLLADVLEIGNEEMEKTACEFEHSISADVADSICTLLGHPRMCPHGRPIPEGGCCGKAESRIESIVAPLNSLGIGEKGLVAYIITADHPHLHKLLSLGIVPGTEIQLHQKAPTYVIKVKETQIALDKDVAGQIYVRRA
jgi:DtxR family Mn-dependent transcriptional regulator